MFRIQTYSKRLQVNLSKILGNCIEPLLSQSWLSTVAKHHSKVPTFYAKQEQLAVYRFIATKQVYRKKIPALVLLFSMSDLYTVFVIEQAYIYLYISSWAWCPTHKTQSAAKQCKFEPAQPIGQERIRMRGLTGLKPPPKSPEKNYLLIQIRSISCFALLATSRDITISPIAVVDKFFLHNRRLML